MDVWSVGVLAFRLSTREVPFVNGYDPEYRLPERLLRNFNREGTEFQDLILGMLCMDPEQIFGVQEWLDRL